LKIAIEIVDFPLNMVDLSISFLYVKTINVFFNSPIDEQMLRLQQPPEVTSTSAAVSAPRC
jgi:hypothetical protein